MVSLSVSSERPATMTFAPSAAKRCATARPIPEPPPVISATRSLSFMCSLECCHRKSSCRSGLRWRARMIPKVMEKLALFGLRFLDVALFDQPEAADALRNACNGDRYGVVGSRQIYNKLLDYASVIVNEPSLHVPLCRVAERIEGRATQPFEAGKYREKFKHPFTISALDRATCRGIA